MKNLAENSTKNAHQNDNNILLGNTLEKDKIKCNNNCKCICKLIKQNNNNLN